MTEFLRGLEHPLKDGIQELRVQLIRGTVTFQDLEDADAKLGAVAELVGRWMRATA